MGLNEQVDVREKEEEKSMLTSRFVAWMVDGGRNLLLQKVSFGIRQLWCDIR